MSWLMLGCICAVIAMLIVLYITVNEMRTLAYRVRKCRNDIHEQEEIVGMLTQQLNDEHNTIQRDYFNHMKDINEINKRIIKIERRLDNEGK